MNELLTIIVLFVLIFVFEKLPSIIVNWSLVEKAGLPGWSQIIPFYSTLTRAKIAGGLNVAIGLMISEPFLIVLLFIGLVVPSAAVFCVNLGIILLIISDLLWVVLNFRFVAKYVIVDNQGVPTRQIRWRSSLLTLFYLKNISYRSEALVAAHPEAIVGTRMVGFEKSDYLPTGFDKVAVAAGWVSMLSFPLLFFAPFSLVLGIVAVGRVRKHPERKGRGRAWFAIIWGALWTLVFIFVVYYIAAHPHTNS